MFLNFSIGSFYFSIGTDRGKDADVNIAGGRFHQIVNRLLQKKEAKRVTDKLQLMREEDARELFSRLYPEFDYLISNQVKAHAHDTSVGNILFVTTSPNEIQVRLKEQVEPLLFTFDTLNKEVQIKFEGSVLCHRVIRVETSDSKTKPFLSYQSRPGEPFVLISWNNLPQIVAESIEVLLLGQA